MIDEAVLRLALLGSLACVAITPASAAEWVERVTESFDDADGFAERWELLDPAGWRLSEDPERGGMAQVVERYGAYKPPHRSPVHVALLKDVPVGDFRLTIDARSPQDTGPHRDCCIFFGWQNAAQFYYVHLGALPDPHSGQVMLVDNADRRALTENTNPVGWADGWSTIRVERRLADGRIRIYFDDLDTPVMEVSDTTLGAGLVGLGSFDDLVDYDNLVLEVVAAE